MALNSGPMLCVSNFTFGLGSSKTYGSHARISASPQGLGSPQAGYPGNPPQQFGLNFGSAVTPSPTPPAPTPKIRGRYPQVIPPVGMQFDPSCSSPTLPASPKARYSPRVPQVPPTVPEMAPFSGGQLSQQSPRVICSPAPPGYFRTCSPPHSTSIQLSVSQSHPLLTPRPGSKSPQPDCTGRSRPVRMLSPTYVKRNTVERQQSHKDAGQQQETEQPIHMQKECKHDASPGQVFRMISTCSKKDDTSVKGSFNRPSRGSFRRKMSKALSPSRGQPSEYAAQEDNTAEMRLKKYSPGSTVSESCSVSGSVSTDVPSDSPMGARRCLGLGLAPALGPQLTSIDSLAKTSDVAQATESPASSSSPVSLADKGTLHSRLHARPNSPDQAKRRSSAALSPARGPPSEFSRKSTAREGYLAAAMMDSCHSPSGGSLTKDKAEAPLTGGLAISWDTAGTDIERKELLEEQTRKVINSPPCAISGAWTCTGTKVDTPDWVNQDCHLLLPVSKGRVLAAVFDGHGTYGHKVALSVRAVFSRIFPSLLDSVTPSEAFYQVFARCQAILERGEECAAYSGTTVAAALVDPASQRLTVAHVGDSACVVFKGGTDVFATRDHKVDFEATQKIIARGGEVRMCHDIHGKPISRIYAKGSCVPALNLSRSLGDLHAKQLGVSATPEVKTGLTFTAGSILVLASDGVWDQLSHEEVLASCLDSEPEASARNVVRAARERWAQQQEMDDITAVVVQSNSVGSAAQKHIQSSQHTESKDPASTGAAQASPEHSL